MVAPRKTPDKRKCRRAVIGIGLDNPEGITRITRVEDFHLFGGSTDTHGQLQEKAIKFNEELKKGGKTLQETTTGECRDIAADLDMKMLSEDA